ncbi:MAG: hypothetical protein MZW92_42360 [Comamonadaceae bacterium]|nr:hypothetical protein [Comamonadaceae bacterium]
MAIALRTNTSQRGLVSPGRARRLGERRLRPPRRGSWRGGASTSRPSRPARPAFAVAVPSWGVAHRRHALRAVPRAGRAAQRLREARRLPRHQPPRARHAGHLAAHPVGRARRSCRAARPSRPIAGLIARHDELEHVRGPAGPGALVQVRQPDAHRPRGPRAGRRAQPALHRARHGARRPRALGLDRRRRQLPGQQHVRRALDRYLDSLRADLRARCPTAGALFIEHKLYEPAFYSTVLNDWGVSYHCARELGDRRRSRWWTSATTRRT